MALNYCKILKLNVKAFVGQVYHQGRIRCTLVFYSYSQNAAEGQHPKIDLTSLMLISQN